MGLSLSDPLFVCCSGCTQRLRTEAASSERRGEHDAGAQGGVRTTTPGRDTAADPTREQRRAAAESRTDHRAQTLTAVLVIVVTEQVTLELARRFYIGQ